MAQSIDASMKLHEPRSLSFRRWGKGWQVCELRAGGGRRTLRGSEKRRALLTLGAIYRRGDCDPWPKTTVTGA